MAGPVGMNDATGVSETSDNAGHGGVVIGVDGGGTKTEVVVAALDGSVVGTAKVGGANPEGMGARRMAEVIAGGLDAALAVAGRERGDVVASAFGLAGVDWDSDVVTVDDALADLGLPGHRTVVNDSQIALRAGCSQRWGIVSNVGTGAVTAGVNRTGRWFRTMAVGWGEPSGSWSMVAESLHAIAAAHHRTGPATALTELYLDALEHTDVLALFESITRGRSNVSGRLAPLLDRAVELGDEVAKKVLVDVAAQHAAMVIGVAHHLEMIDDEFELVTAGGVHHSGGGFSDIFAAHVIASCSRASIVPLDVRPAMGAVTLALESLPAQMRASTRTAGRIS